MGAAVLARGRAGITGLSSSLAQDLALVAAVALLFRVYGLLRLPIFWDEGIYLRWAADIWEQRTRMALLIPMADDGKQPLFMWLAGGAAYLLHDPLLAGRLVSAMAGVASATGVYFAGAWLLGRPVGLVAAMLYSVAPFTLLFDRMALVDALLNTTGVGTFCAAVFVVTRARSRRDAALSATVVGLALGAAIWTKMTALFLLPIPLLCALMLPPGKQVLAALRRLALGYAVFAAFAVLLAGMPQAYRLMDKAETFTASSGQLFSLPWDLWRAHVVGYWEWVDAYLPAPLSWLVLVAVARGLLLRSRRSLLLLGCWAAFTIPLWVTAYKMYESRYVMPGVFPLLLLTADAVVWAWRRGRPAIQRRLAPRSGDRPLLGAAIGAALLLIVAGPSLAFDARLLTVPESAGFAEGDRREYITGWSSGYGFAEALKLVKQRTMDLTRGGAQPIILISDQFHGLPFDGIKLYMRGIPGLFHYIDNHLYRDPEGFLAAWRPHHVPLLVFGNLGPDHLDEFERAVPQARRIGYFPKPTGQYSFRVYEVALEDLGP